MKLYLDDDSAAAVLVVLLRRAGHDVQIPFDLGIAGADDPVHLTHAVLQDRVLLSHNYCDFEQLHDLVVARSPTCSVPARRSPMPTTS
jgi:hypothetical protein